MLFLMPNKQLPSSKWNQYANIGTTELFYRVSDTLKAVQTGEVMAIFVSFFMCSMIQCSLLFSFWKSGLTSWMSVIGINCTSYYTRRHEASAYRLQHYVHSYTGVLWRLVHPAPPSTHTAAVQ